MPVVSRVGKGRPVIGGVSTRLPQGIGGLNTIKVSSDDEYTGSGEGEHPQHPKLLAVAADVEQELLIAAGLVGHDVIQRIAEGREIALLEEQLNSTAC